MAEMRSISWVDLDHELSWTKPGTTEDILLVLVQQDEFLDLVPSSFGPDIFS